MRHSLSLFHNVFFSGYNMCPKLKYIQILMYENWKDKHVLVVFGFLVSWLVCFLIFAPETTQFLFFFSKCVKYFLSLVY